MELEQLKAERQAILEAYDDAIAKLEKGEQLDEGFLTTVRALLGTGAKVAAGAGKAAVEKVKKVGSAIREIYLDKKAQIELAELIKGLGKALEDLDKAFTKAPTIYKRDAEVAKEMDLFKTLFTKTIGTLQARQEKVAESEENQAMMQKLLEDADKEFDTLILERLGHSWAILPATMELYRRRTVDILTAASEWNESTILVCENEQGRTCFVSSAGDAYDHYKNDIGKSFATHHDQTGASKGQYKLKNVVHIKDGKIVKSMNDTGLKAKASLAVFK